MEIKKRADDIDVYHQVGDIQVSGEIQIRLDMVELKINFQFLFLS